MWRESAITSRTDGSYVIVFKGHPYHVLQDAADQTMAALWGEVDAFARTHPQSIRQEPESPLPSELEAAATLRAERNARIAQTDCMVLPDSPLDTEERLLVLQYRQALRDLPGREGFPWVGGVVHWPELELTIF